MKSSDGGAGKVFAGKKEFCLTSRDRFYLQLSRLPSICQEAVRAAFGGESLQALAAASIAKRLLAESIPVSELDKAEYPSEVVE